MKIQKLFKIVASAWRRLYLNATSHHAAIVPAASPVSKNHPNFCHHPCHDGYPNTTSHHAATIPAISPVPKNHPNFCDHPGHEGRRGRRKCVASLTRSGLPLYVFQCEDCYRWIAVTPAVGGGWRTVSFGSHYETGDRNFLPPPLRAEPVPIRSKVEIRRLPKTPLLPRHAVSGA
jgi:hypothetical protein